MILITSFKCSQGEMEIKGQKNEWKNWEKNEDTTSSETGNKGKM